MGLEAAVVVAVVVKRFLHVSPPSDRLLGPGVVVEAVVAQRSPVCVLARTGRSLGFAELVPAVSTLGLLAEARRSRSVFELASDPNQFLLSAGRENSG